MLNEFVERYTSPFEQPLIRWYPIGGFLRLGGLMAFQSTKFLSLLDLQSFCANCPTATVQAVRIRDLEKEVAVLKAENLQLKADNAQMRRLWEEYQSLLDESSCKSSILGLHYSLRPV